MTIVEQETSASVSSPREERVLAILTEARVNGFTESVWRKLIPEALDEYRPVARRFGFQPEDILAPLWEFWMEEPPVTGLLPKTAAYLHYTLQREASAQTRLTSVEGTRRVGAKDYILVGEPEESDAIVDEPELDESRDSLNSLGLLSIRHLLIAAGLDEEKATALIEAVTDQLAVSSSIPGAIKVLGAEAPLAARLGLSLAQWRALVGLVLGTNRGHPGLYELVSRGHPNPRRLGYIRRQIARLLEYDSSD